MPGCVYAVPDCHSKLIEVNFNGRPKPRTLYAPIRSAVLAGKHGNLQFHLIVVLSPSKYLSFTPLALLSLPRFIHNTSFFLLFSLSCYVSWSLFPFESLSLSIFAGALDVFFFSLSLSPFLIFFMQDVSLNNFKSQSLPFSISAPICLFVPLFPASPRRFFPFLRLSCSPSLCGCAQQRLKEAPEHRVWVYVNKNERKSVPASLRLPLCQCLPLGCQWQSEFICCAVTGLMIDVAPANSKPIRRLM